ncbi:MAG TPA: 2OG-Fe(II) oxygenase [Aliidongia sp.]|nr:2OG-Fe(II) oxygenase [Aliidongia sp.]
MQSLLSRLSPADIRTEPFPHIVAEDVLEPDLCAVLGRTVPEFERFGWAGTPPSNQRYIMPAHRIAQDEAMPAIWRDFARHHSGPEFLAEIAALFAGHWAPAMLDRLGGSLLGHTGGLCWRDDPAAVRILQDARLEINTPVTKKPGSPRGAHLDTANRLYSGLYYLRDPDDDSVGGDLVLYRFRSAPPRHIDVFAFDDDQVEAVATIPYRANNLVLFPQGLHAIHGVSPRQLTPWTRKYVFITAEIGEDWLASPAAARLEA